MLHAPAPTSPKRRRKVYLTGFTKNQTLLAGKELAKKSHLHNFEFTEAPDAAEIILYLEYGYVGLTELPRLLGYLRSAPKALHFLFSESDWPFPILPGAYPSLSKPCAWAHSWSYLPKSMVEEIAPVSASEPEFLFSFLGRSWTHRVRNQVLLLDSPSSPCLDLDQGPARLPAFNYSKSYRELISQSKFILCPRGFGASSIRIFEAMSAARVPVIISDRWHPTPLVPWQDFSVLVAEKDVLRIPTLLHQLESGWEEKGKLARRAFDEFFAPNVFFERLLDVMERSYSGYDFSIGSTISRAGRALRWREIWTLGSQAKTFTLESLAKITPR
jgi:hypothetical protein